MVKIPKKINNEAGAMYCFINIFSDFIIDDFMFKKNSEFSPILKKSVSGTPVPSEYGSTVKNLTLTF